MILKLLCTIIGMFCAVSIIFCVILAIYHIYDDYFYVPPCMRKSSSKSNHKTQKKQDNSPFVIIDTIGCGYRIVDKKTHKTIAEMLPSGRWINYYLGEID